MTRPMHEIPISAAQHVADEFGYDQVVIMARRVGEHPDPCGEHITTYGIDPTHCRIAAAMGNRLKSIASWPGVQSAVEQIAALEAALAEQLAALAEKAA